MDTRLSRLSDSKARTKVLSLIQFPAKLVGKSCLLMESTVHRSEFHGTQCLSIALAYWPIEREIKKDQFALEDPTKQNEYIPTYVGKGQPPAYSDPAARMLRKTCVQVLPNATQAFELKIE
jgi:hypothetical protein